MLIEFEIEADVLERQELLNGTQIVTFEGATADGRWTIAGSVSWNIGLDADAGNASEGDLTLTRDDGAELFASLAGGDVRESAEDGTHSVELRHEIDGGFGAFEAAAAGAGVVVGAGTLAGDALTCRWTVELATAVEGDPN